MIVPAVIYPAEVVIMESTARPLRSLSAPSLTRSHTQPTLLTSSPAPRPITPSHTPPEPSHFTHLVWEATFSVTGAVAFVMYARLISLGEDGEGPPASLPRQLYLKKEINTIGRSRSADHTIDSECYPTTISRNHVHIVRQNTTSDDEVRWKVKDLSSLNGTFINNVKVVQSRIYHGETLTLGGGAGIMPGERSDLLASDIVFRFELLTEIDARRAGLLDSNVDDAAREQALTPVHGIKSNSNKRRCCELPNEGNKNKRMRVDKADAATAQPEAMTTAQSNGATKVSPSTPALDDLMCSVCLEPILNASILMCSHTFCKTCIANCLRTKPHCPYCRTPVTDIPRPCHEINAIVNHLVPQKDLQMRKNRLAVQQDREKHAVESLKKRLRDTDITNKQMVTEEWSDEQRHMFDEGVDRYYDKNRIRYCKAFGLTNQFLQNASQTDLLRAAINVGVLNEDNKCYLKPGTEIPPQFERRKLHDRLKMFIHFK